MFRLIGLSGVLALALACAPAAAQNAPPAADQGAPQTDQGPPPGGSADQGPPPGAAPGGKPSAKQLIAGCRSDARAKGLTGDALKAAVGECVGAQRPKVAARMQCRQQGKAQGLAGDQLTAFVKSCVAQGPGPGGQTMAAPADQGPPPANGASADQGPPPAAALGGKPPAKQLIASCRSDARAKGLTGDALKAAVGECVGAQRPKVAARMQCRQQGKAQGLAGDQLTAFVKSCVAQGPGPGGQSMAAPADQGPPPANGAPADQGPPPGATADQGRRQQPRRAASRRPSSSSRVAAATPGPRG